LVPRDAPEDQSVGTSAAEGDITSGEGTDGLDDAIEIYPGGGRATFLPSSIGLSVLVPEGITSLYQGCWGGRPNGISCQS
jgi:hypothetical protein